MKAGGFLIDETGQKLSQMASPATPKEVNNNLDMEEGINEGKEKFKEIFLGPVHLLMLRNYVSPLILLFGQIRLPYVCDH